MYHDRPEDELDAELRNVALPQGLRDRLKRVIQPTDSELDAALVALPVPSGLAGRAKSAIADASLDETLCEVPIPADLLARLRIIPEVRTVSRLRRFALVASLLLVVTGSFFGMLGGLLAARQPVADALTTLHVIDVGPTRFVAMPAEPVHITEGHDSRLFDAATVPVLWRGAPLQVDLVRLDETTSLGPAGQLIREVQRGLQLESDVLLMRWNAYGSPQQASQRLPELEQIRQLPRAGVDLPFVAGYDRSLLLRTATHPPVVVAADPQLQNLRVPLSTSDASVRRAEQLIGVGRLPDPQEIRPEDFLAAIDYGFAVPPSADVSVSLAAGRAPLGAERRTLLQVGVRAARRMGDLATHVAIVLDVSQSMGQQQRLEKARAALQTTVDHLDSNDSVSLVAVNHEVTQQIDFATAEQVDELRDWIHGLQAGGGDRLVAGARAALSLALEAAPEREMLRQLVVVTDDAARLTEYERRELDKLFAIAVESDVRTTVLRIGGEGSGADTSSDLGISRTAMTLPADALRWKLVELVTGESPLVARQVQVEMTFNPKAVRAYRLVGHGPSATTGLGEGLWTADLHSGQQATLLFELWMHDSLEDEVVAAEVHWQAGQQGDGRQSDRRSLSRYDLATTWLESPPPLQVAAIAAEIGDRLAGLGNFELQGEQSFRRVRKPAGWTDVLNAAEQLAPEAADLDGFSRLVRLVHQLEAHRRGVRSSNGP